MRIQNRALSTVVLAGMELCWRYAWANYTVTALLKRPFPLPEAAGIFLFAAFLTRFHQGRGWRVIGIGFLQATGWCCASLVMIYALYDFSHPLWNRLWVADFFKKPRDFQEWFVLAVVLLWTVTFWVGGVTLGRRRPSYLAVCARFDLGIAYFAALFFLRWTLRAKGGIETSTAMADVLLFPYFIFSLSAIAFLRCQGEGRKDFLSGYSGIGMLLVPVVCLLFLGTAVALLFLPYLTAAAEAGYTVIQSAASPLVPIIVGVLRFVLMGRQRRQEPLYGNNSMPGIDSTSSKGAGWGNGVETYIMWGMEILLGALLIFALAAGAWYLIRWLLLKTPEERQKGTASRGFLDWVKTLLTTFRAVVSRMLLRRKKTLNAVSLYLSLRTWGRRSGVPPSASETPLEYALRLTGRFPSLKGEIGRIIALFNQEVYGERTLQEKQLAEGASAWKRLRSPRIWSYRVRSLFLPSASDGPREYEGT